MVPFSPLLSARIVQVSWGWASCLSWSPQGPQGAAHCMSCHWPLLRVWEGRDVPSPMWLWSYPSSVLCSAQSLHNTNTSLTECTEFWQCLCRAFFPQAGVLIWLHSDSISSHPLSTPQIKPWVVIVSLTSVFIYLFSCLFLEMEAYMVQFALELTVRSRVTLNLWSFCSPFPGFWDHRQNLPHLVYAVLRTTPKTSSVPLTELGPPCTNLHTLFIKLQLYQITDRVVINTYCCLGDSFKAQLLTKAN